MTAVPGEHLRSAYLDILVDVCRRHQYSRAEMLLPGAISDAECHEFVDQKLESVIHDLVDVALAEGCIEKARELLESLIRLKQSTPTGDHGCDFENLVLQQIRRTAPGAIDLHTALHRYVGIARAFVHLTVGLFSFRWLSAMAHQEYNRLFSLANDGQLARKIQTLVAISTEQV